MDEEMSGDEIKAEGEEIADESTEMHDCGDAVESGEAGTADPAQNKRVQRYAPHTIPDWHFEEIRERYMWNIQIFPIDPEDCKNCILETATKIAHESWYHVPNRANGQGYAELCVVTTNKASSVMAKLIQVPFYYRYVTFELTHRAQEEGENNSETKVRKKIVETATLVYDSTKCDSHRNAPNFKGNFKKRKLWARYLNETITTDMLNVLFPVALNVRIQQHDGLLIGMMEIATRLELVFFMKSYLAIIINGLHIMCVHTRTPKDNEIEFKAELEKTVTPVSDLEQAPIEPANRSDDIEIPRTLKRALNELQAAAEKRVANQRRSRGEPVITKGKSRNWKDDRRSGGSPYRGGGYGYSGVPSSYGATAYTPEDMAAEMMMMQAELNHTIENQLMMLNSGGGMGGRGRYSGGGGGGRRDGGGYYGFGGGW